MRIIYGINPVTEAIKAASNGAYSIDRVVACEKPGKSGGGAIDKVLALARKCGVRVESVSPKRLDELSTTAGGGPDRQVHSERKVAHQGIVALIKGGFPYRDLDGLVSAWRRSNGPALILLLDSIEDPQNMGTLIRSAHCAGVDGVVITKDRSAEVTPTVVKASAGATEHTPIARVTNLVRALKGLKDEGVWTIAIEARAIEAGAIEAGGIEAGGIGAAGMGAGEKETGFGKTIYECDLASDIALVIGSEAKGIRRLVKKECDIQAGIPMRGRLNSLNAAQAGAVVLFEALRQRAKSSSKRR